MKLPSSAGAHGEARRSKRLKNPLRLMRSSSLVLSVLASSVGLAAQGVAPIQRAAVTLNSNQLPAGARITDVQMNIDGAAIASIANLPIGWTVTSEADSALKSSLSAHSKSAEFALREGAFRKVDVQILFHSTSTSPVSVDALFTILTRDGQVRRIPMSSYSFTLESIFIRRVLPVPRP